MAFAASACLLGFRCRYDGRTSPDETLMKRAAKEVAIPICPEELGGLPTPRARSRIQGGDGFDVLRGRARVLDDAGNDVTGAFVTGALEALRQIKANRVRTCFMKDKSPSCGLGGGPGSGSPIGVAAALLVGQGVEVVEVKARAVNEA